MITIGWDIMEKSERSKYLPIEVAICAGAFLVTLFMARATLLPALVLPIIAAYVTARQDALWTAAFYVSALAFIYLLISAHWWAMFLALVIASLPCGLAIKKRAGAYEALIISAAGWLAAAVLLVGYVYLHTGSDILTYSTERANAALKGSPMLTHMVYMSARAQDILAGKLNYTEFLQTSQEQMLKYIDSGNIVSQTLGYYIPTMIMGTVVAGGFVGYIAARAIAKARGSAVAYLPPFERFYLPRKVSKYFLLMYIVSLLPDLFGWEDYYIAGYVLSSLISTVFMIQGISFVEFLLKLKLKNRGLRAFLVTVISLSISGLLVYVGLIEQMIRIRDARFTLLDKSNSDGGNKI